jgi:hypothetical protein
VQDETVSGCFPFKGCGGKRGPLFDWQKYSARPSTKGGLQRQYSILVLTKANDVHTAGFEKRNRTLLCPPIHSADFSFVESEAVILVVSIAGWVMLLIAFVFLSAVVIGTSLKNRRSASARVIPFRRKGRRSSRASARAGTSEAAEASKTKLATSSLGPREIKKP